MVDTNRRQWTQKESRDRYVMGDEITTRELAKLANRDPATIGRWSSADNWVEQRKQFANRMQTTTESKIIEKTSDRISDDLSELNEEHVKGCELFRKMSQQFAGILANHIQTSSKDIRFALVTEKEFTLALQRYSGIFATSLQLERQALAMDYLNLDKAIAKTMDAGLEVSNPSLDLMAQQLQEAGFTVMPPQKLVNQE